jgi:DNA-binding MarR family transcriptional regulator
VEHNWGESPSFLLAALGAYTQIKFAELIAGIGLLPQHVGVLRRLKAKEGSSQQEVADFLRVRRSVMVGLVDELEAEGLVERRRHPADRRANALHLTAAGKRSLSKIESLTKALDSELLDAVSANERMSLQEHLHRLSVTLGVADGVFPTFSDGSPVVATQSQQGRAEQSA